MIGEKFYKEKKGVSTCAAENFAYVFHLVFDSATYILDILVDLFHACFATLLVPRHHVDKLLIGFFIVRVWLNLVNLDFGSIELDLVYLFSKNKGLDLMLMWSE